MDQKSFEQVTTDITILRSKIENIEMLLLNSNLFTGSNDKAFSNSFKVVKCGSGYNKSDLAQLFYVLMSENILFFDRRDEDNNRSKMQEFIVNNFTYSGDAGVQTPIEMISKQFSEAKGFTYRKKHLKFLDRMLAVLEERKLKMASK